MIIVFDIDGTLADCSHRLPYIQQTPPDWEAFHASSWEDKPIWPIVEVWRCLEYESNSIIVCSGRPESTRGVTLGWLLRHGLQPNAAYFRPAQDYRPDDIVKEELLSRIITDYGTPHIVFEDRQRCVDMWRRNGIICCQVAKGDF